ncbi:glucose 1-dehydrogenase [Cellulomonas cellasea]|uniref:3-alpha-hydroxysteroid dehydrogenase n=2 Tax=Cellulomonas cellasea TaxID=43670 RepID=A0A0A0B1H1_9CELL|nr:glucose 1-dehydrogenase [Cellulomonas cellasea]KGM00670.1 3-alpha-hydroxysteroid dehydrogenase [Cellulomonas cellasea DSM 20118]GEA87401.1 3-alpha-hydroxysteroid dehydrogenase [Cellulomonas cellasea]
MTELDGRVALVSGGARGLGAAYVRALHERGATVVVGDLLDDEGTALADELGERVRFVHLDVTSEEDWAAAVEVAVGLGGVDVLVNNAGIANAGRIERYGREKWDAVIAVNLTGTYLGVRAVVPVMKAAGRGSIVNISSVEGMRGDAGLHGYVASKFGVRGLTKSLAVELGADGIRVNSVHPGFVLTPMTERLDVTLQRIPLGRPAVPADLVGAVLFLAGDASAYVTGTELVVDGGMIAGVPHA